MRALHAFEGIGGITLGLERAGIESAGGIEIDKFCNRVLERRWPDVPRWRDVRDFARDDDFPAVDVVTGGVPCQDISVAGKRAGLGGERSGLFFEFVRIVDTLAPEWVLFENVAGLLSSKSSASASLKGDSDGDDDARDYHSGEDFAVLLGELTGFRPAVPEDGWRSAGICVGPKRAAAWRLYDSQYFGVAQRRKRVFVVCHPRAEIAGAVLFDAEGGQGNPSPRDQKGAIAAGDLARSVASVGGGNDYGANKGTLVAAPEVAFAIRHTQHKQNGSPERGDVTLVTERDVAAPLTGGGHPNSNIPSRHMEDDVNLVATFNVQPVKGARDTLEAHPTSTAEAVVRVGGSRRSDRGTMAVFRMSRRAQSVDDHETWLPDDVANTLTPFDQGDIRATSLIADGTRLRVRRLTVTEQERLQGFPDGWTCLEDGPYDSYECKCPDAPRVGAIGNAVTVNVAYSIGRRMVEHGARDT